MRHRIGLCTSLLGLAAWLGCSNADVEKMRKTGNRALQRADEAAAKASNQMKAGKRAKTYVDPFDLARDLENRLKTDAMLRGSSIKVIRGKNGVTLSGSVANPYQYRRAGELAREMDGVGKVDNELMIGGR